MTIIYLLIVSVPVRGLFNLTFLTAYNNRSPNRQGFRPRQGII